MKLSIIIPAYNEEENLDIIYSNIKNVFASESYEIIFVDDGSVDKTIKVLESIYKKDKDHVKVISFSRNFGKDAAIYAGLEHSIGEYTCIIDADMEQNPSYLVKMQAFLDDNPEYDQVAMVIKKRKAGFIKNIGGKSFYKLMNHLADIPFTQDASDFRMFRRNVVDAVLSMKEQNRFSKGLFSWVGFNTKIMEYEVGKRAKGETKFTVKKSFSYAVNGIIGYSTKPLKMSMILGFLTAIIGFIYLVYLIIKTLVLGIDVPGFATTISLILFIGGIQLISIGILGEYIAKIFTETKDRPIYIAKKKMGIDEEIL